MKLIILFIALTALLFQNVAAQVTDDPFNWTEPIVIPSSIYVLSSSGADEDSLNAFLNVYFSSVVGNTVENLRKDSIDILVGKNKKMNMEVLDFNNDGIDELIGAWEGSDLDVVLFMLNANYKLRIPVEGSLTSDNGEKRRIFLEAGDFDGDEMDEFLLSYIGADEKIHMKLFNDDGNFNPELVASIHDEDLSGNPSNKTLFSVTAGNFDNDDDDEIALIAYDSDSDPTYEKGVYIKIYDVDGSTIYPKAKEIVIAESDASFPGNEITFDICAVPGYSLQQDRIAISVGVKHNESPNTPDTYLQVLKTSMDLNDLIFDVNERMEDHYNDNYLASVKVLAGDIDANDTAELVFSHGSSLDIYSIHDDLSLTHQLGRGFLSSNDGDDRKDSYDFIEMSNIDNIAGDEIVVAKNMYSNDWENPFPQHMYIQVFGVVNDTLNSFTSKSTADGMDKIPYEWTTRTNALALGNFDNTKVTIQAPKYSRRTDISQPIVILNAPPVHFDNFEGVLYDINTCYSNGEDCSFTASYEIENTKTAEFTSKIQSTWDVSAGLARRGSISVGASVEAAPLGVGGTVDISYSDEFEYHLLGTYGEHMEQTTSSSFKSTINVNITATEDDLIFATITDYDIWDYPYYIGDASEPSGSILTFLPTNVQNRWFPSKSVSAYSYHPNHEVGNILSYFPYDSISTNPHVHEYVVPPSSGSVTLPVHANSKDSWALENNHFTSSQASTGLKYGVDAGFLGFGYSADFDYEDAYVRTHETTIAEDLKLSVVTSNLDRSIGPTEYSITPYAYWSNDGALIIDYSVEPEIDHTGGSTWWQEMYGKNPDPTMILPWRNDPEKGFAIIDESKRQQTKDIILKPTYAQIGDSVRLTANIRNFSLVNTPGNVSARFYLGDPAAGGKLISDINGKSEFETDGPVPARGLKMIRFVWVRTAVSTAERIYMVLDPDNSMEEIHENNNVGWISIQSTQGTTSIQDQLSFEDNGLKLYQNYPNPFSQVSTIHYSTGNDEVITLEIYNMSGVLLRVYDEGYKQAGSYTFDIDGSQYDSGIYLYTLRGSSQTITGTMSIIH